MPVIDRGSAADRGIQYQTDVVDIKTDHFNLSTNSLLRDRARPSSYSARLSFHHNWYSNIKNDRKKLN